MNLYICEKPSQKKLLEQALKELNRNDIVIPLQGHIYSMKEPKEYPDGIKNWEEAVKENKIPFIPKKWEYKLDKKFVNRVKQIKEAVKKVNGIYLATDPDVEGVLLGMEVIEHIPGAKKKLKGMINMGDPTISGIKKNLTNPKLYVQNYKEMYEGGKGRSRSDWILGHNLTTLATVLLRNKIMNNSKNKTIHIGPVKSTIMRLVVDRDLAYENFIPIPYWVIEGFTLIDKNKYKINFSYFNEKSGKFEAKIEQKEIAENYFNLLKKNNIAIVNNIKIKKQKTKPPSPLTLSSLQGIANSRYGYTLKKVMDIVQKLYDFDDKGGFVTYPRTSISKYTYEEFAEFPNIIENLKKNSSIKEIHDCLNLIKDKNNIYERKEVYASMKEIVDKYGGSHTALRPTGRNDLEKLNKDELNIYKIIFEHWIIQMFPDYEFYNKTIELDTSVKEVKGTFSENETINLGFKKILEILNNKNYNEKFSIKDVKKNDKLELIDLELKQKETKPKPYFTEKELIKTLENIANFFDDELIKKTLKGIGIGTEATRTQHIENLIKQGYFLRERKGKKTIIKSTEKARELVKLLPEEVTSPILRAHIEKLITEAKKGKIKEKEILDETNKFLYNIIDKIYEVSKNLKDVNMNTGENTGIKCPKCKKGEIIETDKLFKCSEAKWDNEKKQNIGCDFVIFKKNKLLKKPLNKKDIKELIEKGEIIKDNLKIKLDLNEKYFTTIEFMNNKNLNIKCPKCKKGEIIETDKLFKCSEAKWDNEKKQNIGCDFVIFKKNKLLKKPLNKKDIKELIEKGEIIKDNLKIKLDLNEKYFTTIEFINNRK